MSSTPAVSKSDRIFARLVNPLIQAGIVLGLILLVNIVSYFLRSAGMEIEQRFPWIITTTFILFFAMFNAILSLLSDNLDKYWTRSILSYVLMAGIGGLLAWSFSAMSINEAGPFRWIYIVLTFGYLLFLSMLGFMRKIVDFAQREEWNHPRLRKKKK